ncbi:MAG TPA: hypothetical protein VK484_06885 [Ferruginibacter sp.]|nr:hypothetical protein [Ferruginibacter sp.]
MKKLIVVLTVCVFAVTGKASAQIGTQEQNRSKVEIQGLKAGTNEGPMILNVTSLKDGQNSMLIKQGKGTLQFTKKGDKFSNVSFKDSAGVVRQLVSVPAGTNGAPKPECKNPLPDACFGTADKNIGLCICKPTGISAGYTISFYYVRKHIGNVKYNAVKI